MPRDHKLRHVLAQVFDNGLYMTVEKAAQICELLQLRSEGVTFTAEEIAQRIGDKKQEPAPPYTSPAGVRVIPIMGVIAPRMNLLTETSGGTSNEQLLQAIKDAYADPKVRMVVYRIDSPGGTVQLTPEVSQLIFDNRTVKPSVAVADGQMASAAYFIGSAADQVFASPSAQVGSIGTVYVHSEHSRAHDAEGSKYTVISAGAHKADLNPYEPLSDQGKQTAREFVQALNDGFETAVARNRGVTVEHVKDRFGQGKVFVGSQAVGQGLADRVATFDQVMAELESKLSGSVGNVKAASYPIIFEERTVDELIVQALVGRGLLQQGASEETQKAVLQAWYKARGKEPVADSAQVLKDLMAPAAAKQEAPPKPDVPLPAPAKQEAAPVTEAAAQKAVQEQERQRIREIQASAKSLQIGDDTFVQGLIDGGVPVSEAKSKMVDHLAEKNKPLQRSDLDHATFGDRPAEFLAAATNVLLASYSGLAAKSKPSLTPREQALAKMSASGLARQSLLICGYRVEGLSDIQVCEAALSLGHPAANSILGYGGEGSWNTPAAFPNLFSALQNKFLDPGVEMAEYTYTRWAVKRPSLKDFKPSTIHRLGTMGELSVRGTDGKFPQGSRTEEVNWFSVEEYGEKTSITPVMMANDDLGAFAADLMSLREASEATKNRLCIERLTSNPTLPDGTALFDTSRSNYLDSGSGGSPSRSEAAKMREKMRRQLAPGGMRRMNLSLSHVLVPTTLEDEAEQAFAVGLIPEVTPTVDNARNLFRGRVTPIVDAMLDDASETKWYGFCPSERRQPIVYAYMNGYESDKTTDWYDPDTGSRIVQHEIRFAAGVGDWRGLVLNFGS